MTNTKNHINLNIYDKKKINHINLNIYDTKKKEIHLNISHDQHHKQ